MMIIQILKKAIELGHNIMEWFQVFPYGEVWIEGEAEPAVMDEEGAALILSAFDKQSHDMVVDYEHQTLSGGEAPAAGWITDLEWRGKDGLWAKVNWTDKAHELIVNKEYRYHSPVSFRRKSDRKIVMLFNVALTNQPKMMNVSALVAKQDVILNTNQNQPEETMLKELIKLLGLAEDATEADVLKALAEKLKGDKTVIIAKDSILDALKLEAGATETEVLGAIDGLRLPAKAARDLSQEVVTLKNTIAGMNQKNLIETALKDGKISPDELEKWGKDLALKNPDQFEQIVLSRSKGSVVPVDDLDPKGEEPETGVTDAVLTVAKMMGVEKEDIETFGGVKAAS